MVKANLPVHRAPDGGSALARVDAARAALAVAQTVDEAQRVEAAAKALRELASGVEDLAEAEALAIEASCIALDAARRVGQLLPDGRERTSASVTRDRCVSDVAPGAAKRYRALAAVPDAAWASAMADHRERRVPVTQSAMLKLAPKRSAAPKRYVNHMLWMEQQLARLIKQTRARINEKVGGPTRDKEAEHRIRCDLQTITYDLQEIAERLRSKRTGVPIDGPVPWGEQDGYDEMAVEGGE